MKNKRLVFGLAVVIVLLGTVGWRYYQNNYQPTKIAFVNFMDFQYDRFLEVNDNPYINIERLSLGEEEFPDVSGYHAVYFFAHGNINLNEQQTQTIERAAGGGTKIFFMSPTPMLDLSNVTPEEREFLHTSLQNGGSKNLRGVLNYTRRVLHGKTSHTVEVEEPYVFPQTYYYHLAEEDVFETLKDYEAFYKQSKRYTPDGPKIALVSQILGMQSGSGFLTPLIEGLEARGMNVYPVSGFRGRLDLLKAVEPDLMIFIPHGRLAGEAGIEWLKEANIPMLSPLVVFAPDEEWEKSQQGMDGGMLSQNIVMAELDGGVVPYTIAAQFENDRGLMLFEALDERLEKFTGLVERWIKLQTAANQDKKVVVFYYKGAGKNAMVAEGLEIAPSLLNLLKTLKAEGYDTGELPADADALYERIQAEGPVIGAYAKGALEDYYANGNPALVPASTFRQWMQKWIPADLFAEIEQEYGPAPGPYMSTVRDGESHLVVSRVQFGNVVLMPVPPAGYGNSDIELVHGVKKAPPYPYIGGYLWAKEGFKADAIIHFGTHGSVEFTPWKQVALSDYDWPDILTSGVPHFYLYSMSNIGEALVAKRRTYATMTTHLIPPFMASGIYDDISRLHQSLDRYWSAEDPLLKARYLDTVRELLTTLDMDKDLSIEDIDNVELTKKKLLDIHTYMHELEQAKVTKGLHVLGRPYSDADVYQTVRLMSIDYLAYTLAKLDELDGKITKEQVEDSHVILEQYREPAMAMIDAIYAGQAKPSDFMSEEGGTEFVVTRPQTTGHTHADGTTHTHAHGEDHSHEDGHAHTHGDGHSHTHPHRGDHEHIGKHDGMLAPLRDTSGNRVGQIELKLHDDKGDLELWLFNADGVSPYDIPADSKVTVVFESVESNAAKSGTSVTLSVRNLDNNEDEDGTPNLRDGGMTNYFIFPGESGEDASWLQGTEFKADVLVSFNAGGDLYRTDGFGLIPHTHSGDHGHGHDHPHEEAEASAPMPWAQAEDEVSDDPVEQKRAELAETFRDTLESIGDYREGLVNSPQLELQALVTGLAGGYVEPQSGGDPVVNPSAVPTGRNLTGIDAEQTPTPEAWDVGKQLVDQLIQAKLDETGEYPTKVGFSLWSSEFVRQEGITIAEILYLLGVEPVRNRRGTVHDVRLIPAEELGRPRIDVVVQTSGQFRDLGSSRIYLINQAVALAAEAEGTDEFPNYVRRGTVAAEAGMKENGVSPAEARDLATIRVFGGLNGNYGTGIMGMVESGDSWEEESEVAEQYLNNMGAFYDKDRWGEFQPGMFEAALQNTDTVIQPRSSNVWGPLSLDHVYEFMGGMTLAIRHVTGEDPESYFSDLRNPNKPLVQNAKQAIWQEARTTMLNPKFIAALQDESASAAEVFAETFRNTYGWDVMQPAMIDEEIWDKYEEVYVQDKHNLGIQEFFRDKNPYALQEMTAIMLETVRKGYWNPEDEVVERIVDLHVELVETFEAGCSGFVCDNAKLREMIGQKLDSETRAAYVSQIETVRVSQQAPAQEEVAEGMTLEEKVIQEQTDDPNRTNVTDTTGRAWIPWAATSAVLTGVVGIFLLKRRKVA